MLDPKGMRREHKEKVQGGIKDVCAKLCADEKGAGRKEKRKEKYTAMHIKSCEQSPKHG